MKKLLHLEGLRGVSAFIVFMAHFKPTFCTNVNEDLLNYLGILEIRQRLFAENFLRIFYEGTLPVFIFWFMSAYVISIKLFNPVKNANNNYLIEASTKRYFRLGIPVFFSSLLCFILIKANLLYNHTLAEVLGPGYSDGWLSLWYNFDPGFIHFLRTTLVEVFSTGNSNYNIALWTMTPELMGSFLCFGMFGIAGRNKYRFVFYLVAGLFLILSGFRDVNYFTYVVFLAGIMWADAVHSVDEQIPFRQTIKKLSDSRLFALALLTVSFAATIYSDVYTKLPENLYYMFNYPMKAIALTLLVGNFDGLRKLFSVKPMIFLGKLSFSFYLLHVPVMFSAGIYLYLYAGIESPYKTLVIFLLVTLIVMLVSYVFMKLVDNYAIKISGKIGKYFSSKNNPISPEKN